MWSGPSSSSKIVPRVRSVREGHTSQQLNSALSVREGHASLANASTIMLIPNSYGPARRIDIMSTPEKEQIRDAHYEQTYAHLAHEHCAEREERMNEHCKKLDRDLRHEFQSVHKGIINHCASESQARVDEVATQGHQAIGAIRQQAEQLVEQEVGAVKNQAE